EESPIRTRQSYLFALSAIDIYPNESPNHPQWSAKESLVCRKWLHGRYPLVITGIPNGIDISPTVVTTLPPPTWPTPVFAAVLIINDLSIPVTKLIEQFQISGIKVERNLLIVGSNY
ncbi:hypothetical protein CEXT_353341, partial [Caerostris extrusa]